MQLAPIPSRRERSPLAHAVACRPGPIVWLYLLSRFRPGLLPLHIPSYPYVPLLRFTIINPALLLLAFIMSLSLLSVARPRRLSTARRPINNIIFYDTINNSLIVTPPVPRRYLASGAPSANPPGRAQKGPTPPSSNSCRQQRTNTHFRPSTTTTHLHRPAHRFESLLFANYALHRPRRDLWRGAEIAILLRPCMPMTLRGTMVWTPWAWARYGY